MSLSKNTPIYHPRPDTVDPHSPVHSEIFQRLLKDLQTSKMDYPEQHYLIQGATGIGKTTLLARLHLAITTEQPAVPVTPLLFSEEEYSIRHLYRLWERTIELLGDTSLTAKTLQTWMRSASEKIEKNRPYEKKLFLALRDHLQQSGQRLILFIDNFDQLLEKLSMEDAHRFRKILQTSSELRIIAAATQTPAAFFDYQHPFYEFFKIAYLRPLSETSAIELIQQRTPQEAVTVSPTKNACIETIRRLVNGNTRALVLLAEIMAAYPDLDTFSKFETLLDRLTPTYKYRMDHLSPPQQEIVETIALQYEAISVKEISDQSRLASKVISAQLSQLVKNQLITKIKTSTKNHFYQLTDRLFNYWYLLRLGSSADRQKLHQLLDFIEDWCLHKKAYQTGKFQEIPLLAIDTPPQISPVVARPARSTAPSQTSDLPLRQRASSALASKQYQTAITYLQKVKNKDHFALGYAYQRSNNHPRQAITHYQKAAQRGHSEALNNLGLLYQYQMQDAAQALDAFQEAVEKGSSNARYNLGLFYLRTSQQFPKAIKNLSHETLKDNPEAVCALAQIYYHEEKDTERAISYLEQASTLGDSRADYHLGLLYFQDLKAINSAKHYFKNTLTLKTASAAPLLACWFLVQHGATDFVLAYFQQHEPTRNAYLPLYYAMLQRDTAKYGDELLRMDPTLLETVKSLNI